MLKKIIIAILFTALALIIYSVFIMFSAKNSAIKLSSNEPFCVQVSAMKDYKEIVSIFDLAGFYMHGGHNNHAVLIIGNKSKHRLFHWSYWANTFVEGAYGPPPIYCTPELDFFRNLSAKEISTVNNINFTFNDFEFSIPKAYSPMTIWPDSNPGMIITARAPNFEPTNGELCIGRLCNMTEIHFGILPRLETWRKIADDQHQIENIGEHYGLVKQRVLIKGSNHSSIQYFKLDAKNKVKTIIICAEEVNVQCLHSFYENGISFNFHEMPSDIPNWTTTESTLTGLFSSFGKSLR